MTCIVGIKTKAGVLLAGDALGSAGAAAMPRRDVKVFRLTGEVACGFTSSYRMGQILRFHVAPLPAPVYCDPYEWAVKEFVPVIREAFHDHGFSEIQHNREEGGTFLLAVRDRLFQVEDDFQVGEAIAPYDACGCGDRVALGALYALQGSKLSPRAKLRRALDAACEFSNGVRGPYTFAETRA